MLFEFLDFASVADFQSVCRTLSWIAICWHARRPRMASSAAVLRQILNATRHLGIYESRKRRAAAAAPTELTAILEARREALAQASKLYKQHKAQGKPFTPSEFGVDCSSAEIERQIARESTLATATKP